MCRTPAPPSTALVASSIWSGVGEVKTSPGQAASSIPGPTKPPCMGSCPEPPPDTIPTFPSTGASARTTNGGSYDTRRRAPYASSTPSSASRTTASGGLVNFFIAGSPRVERVEQDGAEGAAHERADHWDPRVAPIGRALAWNRQERVHDPWPEISGGVDRVPSWSTQRQADAEHQEADEKRPDCRERRSRRVREDRQHAEHEHHRADDLGDDVGNRVAKGRSCAEHGELQAGILSFSPVIQVRQIHQRGAYECTAEFAREVLRYITPVGSPFDREPKRDRRVQVCPAELRYCVNRHRDAHSPAPSDDDPAAVLCLGMVQQHSSD